MVNFNGSLNDENSESIANNRAFLYGDGLFETVKILDRKILFFEDHYFRLMSGMRILRMEIPMSFTMEFLEEQLLSTAVALGVENSARVRLTVFRDSGGRYLPTSKDVSFMIQAARLEDSVYQANNSTYEVELYKDYYVSAHLLSTVKTTNKILNITGSIFAAENGYDNCLLLNERKNVVEALNGNLFMVTGKKIVTPPLSEGCLAGIMRKQILLLLKDNVDFEVLEEAISPFDLQKADELFITNVIVGVQSVTRYRKKEYAKEVADLLRSRINAKIRLS